MKSMSNGMVCAGVALGFTLWGCGDMQGRTIDQSEWASQQSDDHGNRATNVYDLVPGVYPDTVSLPYVIRNLNNESEVKKLLRRIETEVNQALGIELKLPSVESMMQNPEKFTDLLQFDLDDIAYGRRRLLAGNITLPIPAKLQNQLPQTFDFTSKDTLNISLPTTDLKEIIIGQVFQGWPRDVSVSDEVCRNNTVFSEVVERLSSNLHQKQNQRFTVVYKGNAYQNLTTFIEALVAAGHEITAEIRHNVANFTGMYFEDDTGTLHPVAFPAFATTSIVDSKKMEAVLPMFHSEIVFRVRPTSATYQDAIQASILYYQGTSRIGFYADQCTKSPAWVGSKVSDRFDPTSAVKALTLTGYFSSLIQQAAEKRRLPIHGYAVLGVCNDSVAIIQQVVHGRVSSWPLLMLDELVIPEIEERLAVGQDVEIYQTLLQSVKSTPSDAVSNPTISQRALTSIPWQQGREPFFSTIDAIRILNEAN